MEYKVIKRTDDNFRSICDVCEKEIVIENLRKNGETLNYSGLTYDSQIMIVVTDKDLPIAFCALVISDIVGVYVYQIAVKKSFKRQGIGTELIKRTKDIADELSLDISAHIREYNKASQRLFEKSEFIKDEKQSTPSEYYYRYQQMVKEPKKSEKGLS